jgi:cytosine/adenosine deaminase-related metal-dependent hydrolase
MTQEISRKSFFKLGAGLAALTAAGVARAAPAHPKPRAAVAIPTKAVKTLIKTVDVLTMEVGNREYHGVDVMLSGGKIAAIGKGLPAGDAKVVDGTGKILMPGFIDGFRHNWQQLNNGLILKTNQSYKSYYTGFNGKVSAAMTPEDFHLAEYLGCVEAIDNGFTSMIDFSQSLRTPEIARAAIQGAKASGIGGFYAYTPPAAGRGKLAGAAEWKFAAELRDTYFTGPEGMQWGVGMGEPWGHSFEDARAYFGGARSTKPGIICMHAGSYGSGGGANGFRDANQARPPGTVREVKDFVEAGMLGPDLHMSHGTALTMEELKLMAAHGVTTSSAVLVEYSYGLTESSNHARARAAGCAASFGFDAPVESTRDTFEMARRGFVCLFHDEETIKIADTYQSDDTLAFMTREGHKSARLDGVSGTVTVGKRADLLLIDTGRFGFPPAGIGTMADRVLNFACYHDIDSVWVSGIQRKSGGQMIGIDWTSLKTQATAATERLYTAVGRPVLGLMKTT